jgi:hypothetical protein
MNDFENELKKQPIRPVPEHWRAQILQQASANTLKRELQPWWAALLWPSPRAWGALAAAWIVMAAFGVATRETSAPRENAQATQIRIAMEEKRRLQAEIEEASLRIDPQPKPRSENRAATKTA